AENLTPVRGEVDAYRHTRALVARARHANPDGSVDEREVELPVRTLLIAAGTQPNTVLAREDATHFPLDGRYFRAIDDDGNAVSPERSAKPTEARVLTTRDADDRYTSFFGDLHPSYFGNVVKAMGSAKQGFPVVSRVLARRSNRPFAETERFLAELNGLLRATVHHVERLTPRI